MSGTGAVVTHLGDPAQMANGLSSRALLEAFRRSLRLEAAVVATEPSLLWQQLSNRLRWYDGVEELLTRERDRRLRAGSPPWFLGLSPIPESPQLLGSVDAAGDLAFLDRSRLVTLDAGTLTVWEGRSGMPLESIELEGGEAARGFAVNATGTVAVVETPEALRVYDVATGALVSRLENSADSAGSSSLDTLDAELGLQSLGVGRTSQSLGLTPDGSLVAGAQSSGEVTVWNADTGRVLSTFPEPVDALTACAFAPDAATLVFATKDGTVRTWRCDGVGRHAVLAEPGTAPATQASRADADAQEVFVREFARARTAAEREAADRVLGCAVAPDGSFAVAVGGELVTVWDLPSGRRRWARQHYGSGRCCAVSPDGLVVLTGGERGVLRLWDAGTGNITGTFAGHTGTVTRCAVSTDGMLVASVAGDGARLWDPAVPGGGELFDRHTDRVTAVVFSPDGKHVASAGADRRVLLWESATRALVRGFEGHDDAVQDCAFVDDGQWLVTAGRDGTSRLWEVRSGEERRRLADAPDPWWGCAASPDGTQALLGGSDALGRVALPSGRRLATYPSEAETWRCRYGPDGTWAVVTGADGRVTFWTVTTEQAEVVAGHQGIAGVCAVSPDGRFVVTGGEDGTVRVWDRPTSQPRLVLRHDAAVWGCAVTADARYVVSTSWDRTLRVWDAAQGHEVMRLTQPAGLHGCAAHPWRMRLAFGDLEGRIHLVEPMGLETGPVLVTAREDQGRLWLRCPSCGDVRDLERQDLGTTYDCPCGLATRVGDAALHVPEPAVAEPDHEEGLERALGKQTPRERVLMFSTKTCLGCGHELELLRHACPRCGSTMASPPNAEALEFMQMRQSRAADLVNRGTLRFQAGDLDEAETAFREAVDVNPWNATACGNLGVALLRRGMKQEALAWFEKAVEIDPNLPGGQEMVGRLRRELPKPQETEPDASPDDEVAEARSAMLAQDWDAAVLHFARAIELVERGEPCQAPTFNLYGERATAQAYRGDYSSSLADLNRALELKPDEWHYLDARGRAHYVLGSYREAVADYTTALTHLPPTGDDAAGVLLYRAASHRQLNEPSEALEDLRRADAACRNPSIASAVEELRRTIISEEGLG